MDTFDKHCVFGNRVRLTKDQIFFLSNQVATKKPDIPYYVCAMTKANVAPGKHKMVRTTKHILSSTHNEHVNNLYLNKFQKFSEKYTADHLQGFLEEPMDVPVLYPQVCDCNHFVRLKNGKDGRAMIISQWKGIVKACKIKKNDICVFFFYNSPASGLWMCVFALN